MQIGKTLQDIVIVGSGNVAEALARAVARTEGLRLRQIFARNAERGAALAAMATKAAREMAVARAAGIPGGATATGVKATGVKATAAGSQEGAPDGLPGGTEWTADPERLARADLYLIAVSDKAVGEVAATLRVGEESVVAHTAGSVPLETLGRFGRRAVFYPLQTFTAGREVDFGQIPLFLEASDAATYAAIETFARRLSERVYPADSAHRAWVHLAGVFACNFANAMYAAGGRALARAGLPFGVLGPLIAETAAKAADAGDPTAIQTGPAVRGDRTTMERHLKMLAGDGELTKIYETISQYIWETSKKR